MGTLPRCPWDDLPEVVGSSACWNRSARSPGGRHYRTWEGTEEAGHALRSGVYLARLVAGEEVATQAMVLLK